MSVPAASERLTAVLRAAQYLSNLSPEQDPWAELAQAMGSFFGSDLVLILRPGDRGEPQLVHEPFSQGISVSEVLRLTRAEIRAVFETGFLGSQILTAPACSLSFLPLPRDRRTAAVVIIGRAGQEPFSKEELEILLALGGLFGNVVARVETERELRSHRQSLEELVAQRTAELESTTARLVQESAERRQAQAALEQAHAELEQILETAADGLRVIDRHGTLLRINATHARRLGRPISEVLGRKCDEVSRCLDCESEACPIKRIASGASRVESEMTRDYPEGTRDEIVISTPFRAKDGALLGIVQVFHDVTERKRAEEALRQSREWLRVTLTSIGDAVIACDTAGRVTFINPVAARLAGWAAEEALAQPVERIFRILNEHTRAPAEDVVARVLRERRVAALANHTALIARDGREIPIEDSAAPILDDHGAVTGVVLVFHDVSAAREARQERETTLEFLSLVNHSTGTSELIEAATAFFQDRSGCEARLLATSTEEDGRTRTCNRRDGEGDESVALIPLRTGSESLGLLQLSGRRKGMFSRECIALWERLAGYLAVAIARSRAEERLRKSEQSLREVDRRKNEFLAVLSHELRNPLAPIKNSLYILDRVAAGSAQAERAKAVINRQAGQLSRLVDDLLDVTRVARNKVRLQCRRVDLNDLLERTLEDQRSVFERSGVDFELELASIPLQVHADPARLSQVVGNLLQNAAKFTPPNGRTRLTVCADAAGKRAIIRVADNGIGMSAETLSHLFEPFMQADKTLDRSEGGLGLGLALVKGLVTLHGGEVTARSEGLGRGAEFVVYLPLESESGVEPPVPRGAPARHRRRVLIIEDNVDAADSLREVLELGEHEVAVAYSGPEGTAKARELRPEVVLCDIGLPGMDGYDVARAFRADEALKGIFLVALSGYALPEDVRRAHEAGFDRHLAKPPSLDMLCELLGTSPVADAPG